MKGVLGPEAIVVAAGELPSFSIDGECSGHSESCKKVSRGKIDDILIKMHDYLHGIVA